MSSYTIKGLAGLGPAMILIFLFLALINPGSRLSAQVFHVMQKGETLYSVARSYSLPYIALLAANDIANPDRIQVGLKLIIPTLHKVEKGETLYGIAKANACTVDSLRAINKLGPQSQIKPGDMLIIPSGKAGSNATAASGQPGSRVSSSAAAGATQTGVSSAAGNPSTDPRDPPAVKVSARSVDKGVSWPVPGDAVYLDGKVFGVMIRAGSQLVESAVANGKVVSAGPFRGYGQVVFVQGRNGLIYVYGGMESLVLRVGDAVKTGQNIGRLAVDAKHGQPVAYFFVFKGSSALDPATAPRD